MAEIVWITFNTLLLIVSFARHQQEGGSPLTMLVSIVMSAVTLSLLVSAPTLFIIFETGWACGGLAVAAMITLTRPPGPPLRELPLIRGAVIRYIIAFGVWLSLLAP
jgi:hypothetical protein